MASLPNAQVCRDRKYIAQDSPNHSALTMRPKRTRTPFSAIKLTIRDSLSGSMFSPIRFSTGGVCKSQIVPNPLPNPNLADAANKLAFTGLAFTLFLTWTTKNRLLHLPLYSTFLTLVYMNRKCNRSNPLVPSLHFNPGIRLSINTRTPRFEQRHIRIP